VVLGLLVLASPASADATPARSGGDRSVYERLLRGEVPVSELRRRPAVSGVRRFGRILVADAGRWSPRPELVRYQWLREGEPVPGSTGRRHRLGVADVGARVSVRVTVSSDGLAPATAESRPTVRVGHRMPVRHRVTYHVETRGRVVADLRVFRRQVQATLDDPRGWRAAGVAFRRVPRRGDFALVLSAAARLPSFSPGCSAQWSCRVGRYVVVNQLRWRVASPVWRRSGRSLRDYRHMVVNHETGHWLGHGHRRCPGRGRPAWVMQQQSKGLAGCRANPWPTAPERRVLRFG
jgi:hypothetical protein